MKKRIYIAVCISAFTLFTACYLLLQPAFAAVGKMSQITITENPNYTATFTADGDRIIAEGVFTEDLPVEIGFTGIDSEYYDKCSISTDSSGEFIAAVTCKPSSSIATYVYLKLQSGATLPYYVYYSDGWYFPDNGLSQTNRAIFDNITVAEPIASAYYISATADEVEISDALYRIQTIADEVTNGVSDDYTKALLLCEWVSDNIYYDHDAADSGVGLSNIAISNVLTIKRTTCAGFANTYAALLEAVGIRSVNIKGSAAAGGVTFETLATGVENHEWVTFWYDDEKRWVYVDSCWNSGNDYVFGTYNESVGTDRYFDPTDEAFSLNHRCDKAEERNYFGALAAIGSGLTPSPSETQESETVTTEPTEEITIPVQTTTEPVTQSPVQTTEQDNSSTDREDEGLSLLWLIPLFLMAGIIVTAIFLIKKRRKNK